jgi:hypothetical protein
VIGRVAATLLAAAALAASAAAPVAFVADLQGSATIEGGGRVRFLAELAPGTRLLLGPGAKVAVTYASSGAEFTLAGPGEFVVGSAEVKAARGAQPSRRTVAVMPEAGVIAKVSRTANAGLRMRGLAAKHDDTVVPTPEARARAETSRGAAKTFSERVMHAVLLQEIGATRDAREAWAGLARERPDLPELGVLAK